MTKIAAVQIDLEEQPPSIEILPTRKSSLKRTNTLAQNHRESMTAKNARLYGQRSSSILPPVQPKRNIDNTAE